MPKVRTDRLRLTRIQEPVNGGLLVLPRPDLEAARHQLELINVHDAGSDAKYLFVALPDFEKKRKTDCMYCTLAEALPELLRAQSFGYGIFIIPHATNGRTAKSIIEVRCLVLDYDGLKTLQELRKLVPTWLQIAMIVRTPRGFHVYIECDPSDGEWRQPKRFRHLLKDLCKVAQSDRGATGQAQPFRLAGFFHLKGQPSRVTIEELNFGSGMNAREVLDKLPVPDPPAPAVPFGELAGVAYPRPFLKHILASCCLKIRNAREGNRWHTIRAQVFRAACYVPWGFGVDYAVSRLWQAVGSHQDAELTEECKPIFRKVWADGIHEGTVRPPTPPASYQKDRDREAWIKRLAGKVADRPEVIIGDLLAQNRGWEKFGTRRQYELGLAKELEKAGRKSKPVKRKGRTTRIYRKPPRVVVPSIDTGRGE